MPTQQAERHRLDPTQSRLRLQTALRLRWFGVIGQLVTVCFVYLGLGFRHTGRVDDGEVVLALPLA